MKNWTYDTFTIHEFEELESTNSYALEMANLHKIFDHEVVLATKQTRGRGRKNRNWKSPDGNLYFSLVLQPEIDLAKITQISFVAIVALRLTIEKIFYDKRLDSSLIKNKWPNDFLIGNKKISGVLLESITSNSICKFVIVGVGVNLISNPIETIFPAGNMRDFGIEITAQNLLKNFLREFEKIYRNWLDFGFSGIRKIWLNKAYKLKDEITVKFDEKNSIKGIFEDLDLEGSLILNSDGFISKICAADVS